MCLKFPNRVKRQPTTARVHFSSSPFSLLDLATPSPPSNMFQKEEYINKRKGKPASAE